MLNPFKLNKPIGASYSLDEDDVLKTKKALSGLGHYKEPKTGATPWPDTKMFDGLKSFQKKEGLKVDGLMKPKGPTEKVLKKKTAGLGLVKGEWDWMRGDKGRKEKKVKQQPWPERRSSLLEPGKDAAEQEARPKPAGEGIESQVGGKQKETQVAFAPGAAYALPLLLPLAAAAGEYLHKETEKRLDKGQSTAPPLMPTEPEKALPPSEPMKEKDKMPEWTESPVAKPPMPDRMENVPAKMDDSFEIYPELDETLRDMGVIVENSRGDKKTQAETNLIIRILDEGLKKRGVRKIHIGGGESVKGKYMKERYIKPSGTDGAARPDGSFQIQNERKNRTEEKILDFNTVDTWKDGITPTARERRALERIKRLKGFHGDSGDVAAFPKSRHYDSSAWERDMREAIDIYLDARYGKKKDK